jgi:yecA family protein
MTHTVSYDELQAMLTAISGAGSAAEAHGLMSGMLCVDSATDTNQWLSDFFGTDTPLPDISVRRCLTDLFTVTRQQLEDFDFSYVLLLPDDDEPLAERALALGEWCQGFLLGIGYAGKDSGWPGECTGILKDLLEIGRLDPEAAGEADESAYVELTEYVRIGVQVIRTEFHSTTSTQLH